MVRFLVKDGHFLVNGKKVSKLVFFKELLKSKYKGYYRKTSTSKKVYWRRISRNDIKQISEAKKKVKASRISKIISTWKINLEDSILYIGEKEKNFEVYDNNMFNDSELKNLENEISKIIHILLKRYRSIGKEYFVRCIFNARYFISDKEDSYINRLSTKGYYDGDKAKENPFVKEIFLKIRDKERTLEIAKEQKIDDIIETNMSELFNKIRLSESIDKITIINLSVVILKVKPKRSKKQK